MGLIIAHAYAVLRRNMKNQITLTPRMNYELAFYVSDMVNNTQMFDKMVRDAESDKKNRRLWKMQRKNQK